jgi:hypothetical protein
VKTVGEEEVLETGEVGGETEVKDGTGEKGMMFVADREGTMGATTILVR